MLSAASGFSDTIRSYSDLSLRHANDLDLGSAQLYFGGLFGLSLSLKRFFEFDPWQTVVDFDPSCVGLAVAFQFRHNETFGADH